MAVDPASSAGGTHLPLRLRWVLLGVLVLGAIAGALFALVSRGSSGPAKLTVGVTAPPATWGPGKRPAPAFRLVDEAGRPVSLASYRGRPVIVTFIDPLCRDFCPLEAHQLNMLVRSLPADARPAILAVSTNVYGNARKNLLRDGMKWRLVPQWRWAVGSGRQLARVWRDYQVGVQVTTRTIRGVRVHDVSHTEAAYVVDKRGDERALFLWPFRAKDLLAVLRRLS